jgi:hypothetical protein
VKMKPMKNEKKPSLADLLPPLSFGEDERLKASLAERGYVGEPIIVDQHGHIIDGVYRNRHCQELRISCPREIRHLGSAWEKYELRVRLNCRRRQLTRVQKRAVIEIYLRCDPKINDKHLADILGISQNTVAEVRENLIATFQIEKFSKLRGRDGKDRPTKYKGIVANTPKEAETAMKIVGDLPQSCEGRVIDITTAKRRAARHRNEKERAERVVVPLTTADIKLVHSRFQDLQIDPETGKLVFADIPYNQGFLPQVTDLAIFAERTLVDGGLFVILCGQYWLHEVIAELGKHLMYRWTIASVWDGDATPVHIGGWKEPHARVISRWKPILVFSKGGFPHRKQWCDVSHVGEKEKQWHPWQQPLEEVERLVEYFSDPGDLVIDPCGGGFTTAVACLRNNRRCISCDCDEKCVANGQQRLAEEMARRTSLPITADIPLAIEPDHVAS